MTTYEKILSMDGQSILEVLQAVLRVRSLRYALEGKPWTEEAIEDIIAVLENHEKRFIQDKFTFYDVLFSFMLKEYEAMKKL